MDTIAEEGWVGLIPRGPLRPPCSRSRQGYDTIAQEGGGRGGGGEGKGKGVYLVAHYGPHTPEVDSVVCVRVEKRSLLCVMG